MVNGLYFYSAFTDKKMATTFTHSFTHHALRHPARRSGLGSSVFLMDTWSDGTGLNNQPSGV